MLGATTVSHRARAYLAKNHIGEIERDTAERQIRDHVRRSELQMQYDYTESLHAAGDDMTHRRKAKME